MANTFDIRFARSGGFAAFLEAPANSLRWKGAGRLSIDAQGISIAVRRGLPFLFPRSRRIAAADLEQVMREGDALRVDFRTAESARVVMPFWVRDADTAEQIVRLLPTTRTVELDHDAAGVGRARYRPDWRSWTIIAGVIGLATLAAMSMRGMNATPAMSAPATENARAPATMAHASAPAATTMPSTIAVPEKAAGPEAPPSATEIPDGNREREAAAPAEFEVPNPYDLASVAESNASPATTAVAAPTSSAPIAMPQADNLTFQVRVIDGVVPIVPGMPSYPAARRQLNLFLNEMSAGGDLWNATVRIYHEADFDDPNLWPLRDMELSVASARRDAQSSGYEAVREFADRLAQRVNLYVR